MLLLPWIVTLQVVHVLAGVLDQHGGDDVHVHPGVPQAGPHCSNQFCIEGYNKLELPPPNNEVIEVIITPHILEIFEISDKDSSITLSMYLGIKWEDSRITNLNQTIEDLQGWDFPSSLTSGSRTLRSTM